MDNDNQHRILVVFFDSTPDPKDIPSPRDFPEPLFSEYDLIHTHTRAQALEDGDLIDVTAQAQDAGLTCPAACTAALYGQLVGNGPNAALRLEAMLHTLRRAIEAGVREWVLQGAQGDGPKEVTFAMQDNHTEGLPEDGERVDAYAAIGPGDDGEPVLTIMLSYED